MSNIWLLNYWSRKIYIQCIHFAPNPVVVEIWKLRNNCDCISNFYFKNDKEIGILLYGHIALFSFTFLFQVFSEYFKELEEESIRDNFVIIYELLDELMDFGYPQTTDSKILQE